MADWSSLPGDLVNRIADRLLATDDLDYYMDLRAVCRGWRSSTADPKNDSARFRPRQWAMLDEVHQSDARLLVNTGTGRFVRKDLPLLRRYFVIVGAGGGMVVLAERTAPHAARVLNPFTGAMIRFEAPVPSRLKFDAHVIGSSPTLVLISDDPQSIYWADPKSKSFIAHTEEHSAHCPFYAAAREDDSFASFSVPNKAKILDLREKLFAEYFAGADGQDGNCFVVQSAGEILIVFKLHQRMEVLKIEDTGSDVVVQPVKSIGRRGLFVGNCGRCLSVDADKFASVDANSIYHVEYRSSDVRVYSLSDGKELCAGGAIGSSTYFSSNDSPPFSVVQLLSCYAYEVRCSELGLEQMIPRSFLDEWMRLRRH